MQLIAIRHTQVDVPKGICYGQTDVPLANTYSSELKKLKPQMIKLEIDAVFSSPLQRCSTLAIDLFQGKYETNPALMEMNFGDWEMQKWDEITDPYFQEWMDNYQTAACPKGESMADLNERVARFTEQLKSTIPSNNTVALVTHAGVIRCLLMQIHKLTPEQVFSRELAFGAVIRFNDFGI